MVDDHDNSVVWDTNSKRIQSSQRAQPHNSAEGKSQTSCGMSNSTTPAIRDFPTSFVTDHHEVQNDTTLQASQHVMIPSLIDWDGPHDIENPQNWSTKRKCWISTITALMAFVVSLGSSTFSAATTVTAKEFGVSDEVMVLAVTLYVIGFACGPLVWGPLSELYGRRTPLMVGTFGFIIFQIPVAMATSLPTIFICRFIAAAFGSAPLAIIAGVYVDIWDAAMRGIATMGYTAAVFAGPVCGPIIGEYTVKNTNLSWRWTIWSTTIMASFFFVLALPTVPETRASMILRRKAARLRYETKNWALHCKLDEEPTHLSYLLNKFGLKPIKMIVKEPILIVMTVYISFVYGILYLIFFAYPISFHSDRQWASGVSSLPFLAVFVGVLSSCAYMAWETKVIYTPKLIAAQKVIPEQRLPPMMIGSVILVVGLFWFAWTSSPSINPWPQIISGVFIGGGIVMVFMSACIYIVDVYLYDANSALAANACVRSFFAAVFPLFATPMYDNLGVQWATSILAFFCVALVPAPFLFYKYGKAIRGWSKYAYELG